MRRVLRAKFKAGLFDNPFVDPAAAVTKVGTKEHLDVALQTARESIVLLKNEGGLLPLRKDLKSIAVIGPNSDHIGYQLGVWTRYVAPAYEPRVVTVLKGISSAVSSGTKVTYVKGCDVLSTFQPVPDDAMPDGFKAEYFNNSNLSGTPALVRTDKRIDFDWGEGSPAPEVNPDNFSVRWTGEFTAPAAGSYQFGLDVDDGVRLFIDGKLIMDAWADHVGRTDASIEFAAGQRCEIKVEYHETAGQAKAHLSIASSALAGAEIAKAVEAAKNAEVAVVVVGDCPEINSEGHDRADLNLTGHQNDLVNAVLATGTPTVVVLVNGRPLTINDIAAKVPAIVEAWNPGEQGGTAVAEVLFGDYNPGGKLTITFPRSTGQLPVYYNYEPGWHAAGYCDGTPASPLYPFGFGLSYTTFEFSAPTLSSAKMKPDGKVDVSVDVTNTGARRGDEVIQLYIHDKYASRVRPVKELKGFKRVSLDPGEKKTVTFTLAGDDLAFYNPEMKRVVEPGTFDIMVGGSSVDVKTVALEVTAR